MGMDDATLGKLVRLRKEETCRTEELKAGIMARAKRISNLSAALQGDLDHLQNSPEYAPGAAAPASCTWGKNSTASPTAASTKS